MVKVAIIGCKKVKDTSIIARDFDAVANGTGTFRDIGPSEITGFMTCGGCPGKRTQERARMLARAGADIIALSSCMDSCGSEGLACPYKEQIRAELDKRFPATIIVGSTLS